MIELKNINKTYFPGKPNQVEALKNVNLTINDGDLVSIMGPSGSGKSTLLHILAMLDEADSGTYLFDRKDVSSLKDSQKSSLRNKDIGFIMQDFGLIDEMSALQNVEIPLIISGAHGKNVKERCKKALISVGLEDRIKQKANLLSGGERQRVAIARALVTNAKIIFADEPTGSVDSKNTLDIMNLFLSLNKRGVTVVIVTHDAKVADMCDRKIKIADGTVSEA
ncbi:MAG: ABC transporter ATP-binding protein [Eubacteriales bacterium]